MGYYLLSAVLLLLDQITKYGIRAGMELNESIPVLAGIFHITYIHNDGAAFQLLEGQQLLLILVTSAALLGLFIYMAKVRKTAHWSLLLPLALLGGGGLGNLVDRVRFGYVVDFFDFRIWPIFNIADICVVVGCGFLLLHLFYFEPRLAKEGETNGAG